MISAFKRLVKTDATPTSTSASTTPATAGSSPPNNGHESSDNHAHPNRLTILNNGVQMISQSLQKKFSKGVNYNMKIVIKGDYNVGKSCLWMRLQGQPFKEQYESSDEIKVANINWNYKLTDDVVKVEVWDIVDRSKKKRAQQQASPANSQQNLKLDSSETVTSTTAKLEPSLDAEFIDVYKNANGCILVYDITKPWTWDYVERELPKIPAHLPVLVIGNHRDMHHHRTVDELKCKFFLESLKRGSLGSTVRYTETSMRTGFGLAYIYKFFNIPFLQLRRENLMQQLEINAKEMDNICEELAHLEENINDEYEGFSDRLNTQRRQQQEENAKDVLKNAKSVDEARRLAKEREAAALAAEQEAVANLAAEPKKIINHLITKVIPPTAAQTPQVSMSVTIDPTKAKNLAIANPTATSNVKNSVSLNDVNGRAIVKSPINLKLTDNSQDDEFNRFLETQPSKSGSQHQLNSANVAANVEHDDEDEVGNNPMVAALKETLDSSDEDVSSINKKISSLAIPLDNDEDKEDISPSSSNHQILPSSSNQQISNEISPKNLVSVEEDDITSPIKPSVADTTLIEQPPIVEAPPAHQIQLNNDDFAFLESLTSSKPPPPSMTKSSSELNDESKKKKKEKSSSEKKSKKENGDEEKTTTKKKKKKDSSETESIDSKASKSDKKEKKSSKSKSSSSKSKKKDAAKPSYYENEEEEEEETVYVKKDIDYEEL